MGGSLSRANDCCSEESCAPPPYPKVGMETWGSQREGRLHLHFPSFPLFPPHNCSLLSLTLSLLHCHHHPCICPVFWSPFCCWEFPRVGLGLSLPHSELPTTLKTHSSSLGQGSCPPFLPSSHTGLLPAQDCYGSICIIPLPIYLATKSDY